jgi:mono/diheme cytochrome c family protein
MFAPKRSLLAVLVFAGLACHRGQLPIPTLATPSVDAGDLVARGEYIVRNAAVCAGCHAADRKDLDGPLSGGSEFKDWRLGTVRAANLTPDSATGIGTWSDGEIVRALRNGQSKGGRLLAPVMPYEWLHDMSDADALAVARYLKSRPPVRHDVGQSPNLFFKLGKLFFIGPKRGAPEPAPPRGPTPAYGGYLVQHVAMCVHCHTPSGGLRDKPDNDRALAGDASPPKGFPANPANLTPDSATGIGRWTEEEFLHTLRTGVNPRGDSLSSFMPWRQVRRMTDDDLRAIYRYLRTLPPIHNEVVRR